MAALNVVLTPRVSEDTHTEVGPAGGASGSLGSGGRLQGDEGAGSDAHTSGASGSFGVDRNDGELALRQSAAATTAEVASVPLGTRGKDVLDCAKDSGASDASELRTFTVRSGTCSARERGDKIEWLLDSGSQANVCSELLSFVRMDADSTHNLTMLNGSSEMNVACGDVHLTVRNMLTGDYEPRLLERVYYTPNARCNLISLSFMLIDADYSMSFSKDKKTIWLTKPCMKLEFKLVDGLYRMWTLKTTGSTVKAKEHLVLGVQKTAKVAGSAAMGLLHNRLNHAGMEEIRRVAQQFDVGFKMNASQLQPYDCVPCRMGKFKKMTYKRDPARRLRPLEKIAVDLCSVKCTSVTGETMFLLAVDEATRFKWAFLLKRKDEAIDLVTALVLQVEREFQAKGWKVAVLHSDQGGEFLNNTLAEFCSKRGIKTTFTNGYSPQENSVVERANGVLMPRVRSMLAATHLPKTLWGEALLHTVFTVNRWTSSALPKGKTPYELLYGKRPDLGVLRTWGCLVQARIEPASCRDMDKLDARTDMCILLGYSHNTKGIKLLSLKDGGVRTSRLENVFCHEKFTASRDCVERALTRDISACDAEVSVPVVEIKSVINTYQDGVGAAHRMVAGTLLEGSDADLDDILAEVVWQAAPTSLSTPATRSCNVHPEGQVLEPATSQLTKGKQRRKRRRVGVEANSDEEVPRALRRPTVEPVKVLPRRKRARPSHLRDFVFHVVIQGAGSVQIPQSYRQAKSSKLWPEWRTAILEELASLKQHQTWRFVPRASIGKAKVITCRWVFAIKRDEHGHIKRYKARLVIHGHKQEYGVNFHETYAPVIRFETIRAAIYYGVQRGWSVMQFDVKTAFLYGPLDEEIYMQRPDGLEEGNDDDVCHLLKSLYGLRQAPFIWNKTLHQKLTKLGFVRLEKDRGLYARKVGGDITMLITVYVDDLLLIGPSDLCETVAKQMREDFQLTSLGEVKYLLGIEITIDRGARRVMYCQEQYIKELLLKFHMASCRGAKTPEPSGTLQVRERAEDDGPLPYRELVGALGYLVSGTRPDIAHAVRNLGKHLANFDVTHYELARYVLRYLKATADYKLVMDVRERNEVELLLYTDADYANDPVDRKSISGYVTMIDGNVISYASRKQGLNAQSTTEAEYVAMAEGIKDLQWLRQLCDELQWEYRTPLLLGDNMASIYMTARPGKHSRTKHIENKYHVSRDLVERDQLKVQHVGTNDMVADIMTKALGAVKFARFRNALKVLSPQDLQ